MKTESKMAVSAPAQLRIEHVITGLRTGGAEMMLLKLLSAADSDFDSTVVSLADGGAVGPRISALGVPVHALKMNRSTPNPTKGLALMRLTRRIRPQLIQGWMYHGNVMASWARLGATGRVPVLWNIRQTVYDLARERRVTAMVIRIGAILSRFPAAIIYNSHTSARQHEALGYRQDKRVIIPNGFDCSLFRPNQEARDKIRHELGVPSDAVLIGLIARYHPMKDHAGFLRAAGRLAGSTPGVRFLLAGTGVHLDEPALAKLIQEAGLDGRVFLLGECSDTASLNAALDIACSSSAWGEGFSNSVGEAMACGVPCVVTDIGDSAFLVSETGLAVPPNDVEALASAMADLTSLESQCRRRLGEAARRRIQAEFSLESVVRRYEELYREHIARQKTR